MRFFTAKRKTCILFCAAVLLLSGCAGSPSESGGDSGAGGAASPAPEAAGPVGLVTAPQGAGRVALGRAGAYELSFPPEGGALLSYIDYATESRMALCTRPECRHRDDTCTAWFAPRGGALFMDAAQSRLFCVTFASADQEVGDVLWELSLDGATRTKLYQFAASESFVDAVAADPEHLYFTARGPGEDPTSARKKLYALDLKSRAARLLTEYGDADWLFGAFDGTLVLLSFENEAGDESFTYRLYDLATGREKSFYHYGYLPDGRRAVTSTDGPFLYVIEPSGEDRARVLKLDMRDGGETLLCGGLPFYGGDLCWIQGFYDEKMIVDVTRAEEETGRVEYRRYSVDCASGQIGELTLTVQDGLLEVFMPLLGGAADTQFLVIERYLSREMTLIGNDGAPYASQRTWPVYALMDKADYWANKPDYRSIRDTGFYQEDE